MGSYSHEKINGGRRERIQQFAHELQQSLPFNQGANSMTLAQGLIIRSVKQMQEKSLGQIKDTDIWSNFTSVFPVHTCLVVATCEMARDHNDAAE